MPQEKSQECPKRCTGRLGRKRSAFTREEESRRGLTFPQTLLSTAVDRRVDRLTNLGLEVLWQEHVEDLQR